MTQASEIPAGTLVAFSSGEYSDYRVNSFGRVLKPINRDVWELMGKSCSVAPEWDKEGDKLFQEDRAVPWLIANGYIASMRPRLFTAENSSLRTPPPTRVPRHACER